MGRHGGGSSSGGGGSSSRSSSGSSSGGGGVRTSNTPFSGCYHRSYYDRHGHVRTIYVSNADYGTKPGFNIGVIFALVFVTIHMLLMMSGFLGSLFTFGSKVGGNAERIFIEDRIDILSDTEEEKILTLLHQVYDKSGMPVTLYTDDYSWKGFYQSLSVYSEELYYNLGIEEDAMLIVFTVGDNEQFYDWEYDMYCGDETIKCLSDKSFDNLLDNFQHSMAKGDLCYALCYAWDGVMDTLAKTTFHPSGLLGLVILVCVYGLFYVVILGSALRQHRIYKYYKENPEQLTKTPIKILAACPNCGASNSMQKEKCSYCDTLLKVSDNKAEFVSSENQ